MRALIEYFLNRSLLVNVISVFVLLVGTITVLGLQREMFPNVDFGYVIIRTVYPGSSSEDVEKLVTIPLERSLKEVDGIEDLNSVSSDGISIITIKVDAEFETETVSDETKDALDTVNDLPEDVEKPIVTEANSRHRSVIQIALTAAEYSDLRTAAQDLQDRLENLSKVSIVSLGGYYEDEIRIEVNPDKLNRYELTIGEVAAAIQNRNLTLSSGKLESKTKNIIVRTISEFTNLQEIEDLVIRTNYSGNKVTVKDIATVTQQPKEADVLQRSGGKRAIFLDVKIKSSADIITTIEQIKEVTNNYKKEGKFPKLEHRFVDDMSYYVKRRLNVLVNNGLFGLVLVLITLLLFLNLKTSILTALGAPIAFMMAFIAMNFFGLSINMISMFGLILVLGMLVDDAIIVAEHFYQKLENGIAPKRAAKEAAIETIKPVTATVVTTMIAFGSLFFMGGIMGKFLWAVPAVVIICLTASLLECFFILPGHLADFAKIRPTQPKKRWYQPLKDHYHKVLAIALKHPLKIMFIFAVLFVISVFTATKMRFELFPGDDMRIALLQLSGPPGNSIEMTDKVVADIEQEIMRVGKKDELDHVKSLIGYWQSKRGNSTKSGPHYGMVIVYLTRPQDRERSTDEIVNEYAAIARKFAGDYNVNAEKIQPGPPKGKPVDIELLGDDLEDLKRASKLVKKELGQVNGVMTTEIDFDDGAPQFVARVSDVDARRLGLNTKQVALELRRALSGDAITEIRESDEDIEIKILLAEEHRGNLDSLKKLHIVNQQGKRIPLIKVLKFVEEPGAFTIRRKDRKRIIAVSGDIDKNLSTPGRVASAMKSKLKELLKEFKDLTFELGGENKDTKESMQGLAKSAFIAIGCIFIVLVVMFNSLGQPLVIMSAIPLGLIGVVWTFIFFGMDLGFMAFMGTVALVGVVVNDSIVLVTFINHTREKVDDIFEAVLKASVSRFRPVILTTFTTVAGLLPMAHSPNGDPFLKPMAISFAYGLLFSSLVTLIFVPCTYMVHAKILHLVECIRHKFRKEPC